MKNDVSESSGEADLVAVKAWHIGTMNDGYFVIDAKPQPAPVDYFCDVDHGVNVIAACGANKELAELLVAEHNARIATRAQPEQATLIAENAALRAALEDMKTPPLILEGDSAVDVASWFVRKANAVLAPPVAKQNQEKADE